MAHPWDELAPSSGGGGGYARWNEDGDTIKGTVTEMTIGSDMGGNPCPQLTVDTADGEVIVSASQAQLRSKLQASPPNIGDTIVIVFTGSAQLPGGKTLKEFDVAVKSGSSNGDTDPIGASSEKARPSAADLL